MATNGKWLVLGTPCSVLRETEKAVLATLGTIAVSAGNGVTEYGGTINENMNLPFSTWLPKSAVEIDEHGLVVRIKARYLVNRYRNTLYGVERVEAGEELEPN